MRAIIFLMVAVLVGCSANAPQKKAEYHIVFFKDYKLIPKNELPYWIAYSITLGKCINEKGVNYDTYPIECENRAREAIVKTLGTSDAPRYYLDLAKVKNSGYMPEYVFYYHGQEQWRISSPDSYRQFSVWRGLELNGHKPETHLIGVMENHIAK